MPTSIETDSIDERVIRVVGETFPGATIALTPPTLLKRDLGADSMQLIALMIALDAEFDVEFAVEDIPRDDVTLEWICEFVRMTVHGASTS